jgi:hypothetical protein
VKDQWTWGEGLIKWGKGVAWGHSLGFFDGMMHSKKEIIKEMKPKFDEFKNKMYKL